ncbi:MAG: membrane protein insertion efficiency factor YidD [Clostridia bacterium]
MKKLALAIIRFYKRYISSSLATNCRYTPTCSIYGMQAIEEWGVFRGTLLALFRVIRCNPFSKGGYNPIPKSRRKNKWLL